MGFDIKEAAEKAVLAVKKNPAVAVGGVLLLAAGAFLFTRKGVTTGDTLNSGLTATNLPAPSLEEIEASIKTTLLKQQDSFMQRILDGSAAKAAGSGSTAVITPAPAPATTPAPAPATVTPAVKTLTTVTADSAPVVPKGQGTKPATLPNVKKDAPAPGGLPDSPVVNPATPAPGGLEYGYTPTPGATPDGPTPPGSTMIGSTADFGVGEGSWKPKEETWEQKRDKAIALSDEKYPGLSIGRAPQDTGSTMLGTAADFGLGELRPGLPSVEPSSGSTMIGSTADFGLGERSWEKGSPDPVTPEAAGKTVAEEDFSYTRQDIEAGKAMAEARQELRERFDAVSAGQDSAVETIPETAPAPSAPEATPTAVEDERANPGDTRKGGR